MAHGEEGVARQLSFPERRFEESIEGVARQIGRGTPSLSFTMGVPLSCKDVARQLSSPEWGVATSIMGVPLELEGVTRQFIDPEGSVTCFVMGVPLEVEGVARQNPLTLYACHSHSWRGTPHLKVITQVWACHLDS